MTSNPSPLRHAILDIPAWFEGELLGHGQTLKDILDPEEVDLILTTVAEHLPEETPIYARKIKDTGDGMDGTWGKTEVRDLLTNAQRRD